MAPDTRDFIVDGEKPSFIGARVYYADGSVSRLALTSKPPKSEGVQALVAFSDRTFRRWIDCHWVMENYRLVLHGEDYYWYDGRDFGATKNYVEIPPTAYVMYGYLIDWQDHKRIARTAEGDRMW